MFNTCGLISIFFERGSKMKGQQLEAGKDTASPGVDAGTTAVRRANPAGAGRANAAVATLRVENLPFTVKVVHSDEALAKAVGVRHAAYARHVPAMAEKLLMPEATDYEDGSVVLLAESKLDGSALGTMRIATNEHKKLSIEQSVELPAWMEDARLAEATRLGVADGRTGKVVKTVLFKAFFKYCQEYGIDWMVIAARSPLDRQYDQLLFTDLYPEQGYIPMRHGGNIQHRVLAFEIATAERRWAAANHPLFDYIVRTHHPDIDVKVNRRTFVAHPIGLGSSPFGAGQRV